MYKISEIVKIVDGKILGNFEDLNIKKISTDTRKDVKDSLFIPLKGEKFDGHNFIKIAYDKGAISSLTEETINENLKNLIKVKDTLKAFGDIAKDFVQKNRIKPISITGTSGKTTVKEILAYLTNFPAPEKSFNNLIGVPQTILNKGKKDFYLILEFGTNRKGEIKRLTEIANPYYAIITNIGFAHLEGFESIDDYASEKLTLIKNSKRLIKGIIFWDNKFIKKGLKNFDDKKLIKVTSAQIKDYRIDNNFSYYKIELEGKEYSIKSKLLGFHNAINFLLCVTLLKELNFNIEEIISKFENFNQIGMRFQIINTEKGYSVINDCYNANLESFKSSLFSFKDLPKKGRKIAVIGDILELGKYSKDIHKELADLINQTDIDEVIGIGNDIKFTIEAINSFREKRYFESKLDAAKYIKDKIKSKDIVLFKASRRIGLENVIKELL